VILADTSVWIDHFRGGDPRLHVALTEGEVLMHPFIIGELACGNFARRDETMDLLGQLPMSRVATHEETLAMIDRRKLMGRGIGYVDAHLLAAVAITPDARLLTNDKRLAGVAVALKLA
jgi:predicted nucleic acid-binding protein